MKFLKKKGFHAAAKALEYVIVGFFHDPGEQEQGHKVWCKRCGTKARATRYHTAYACLDNKNILEPIFVRSIRILKKVTDAKTSPKCYCLRGIIPQSMMDNSVEIQICDARMWCTEGFVQTLSKSKLG